MFGIPAAQFGEQDARFVACLPYTVRQEGYPGNSFDAHDPGGRTHAGIIQREYDAFRRRKGLPQQSVFKAAWPEVCEIYFEQYWLPWCPKLWPGLDLEFFDQAVNEGPAQAIRDLQRALSVKVDGHLGLVTLGACEAVRDRESRDSLLRSYADRRLGFYRHLKTFRWFGRDWTRRTHEIRDQALQMVP